MKKEFTKNLRRGINFITKQKYPEAVECLNSAVEMNPNSAEAYYYLAEALSNNNQLKEAVPHYEKASELNPNDFDIYFQLGRVYFQLKEFPKSLENLKKAHLIDPKNERTIRALGIVSFKNLSIDEGKQYFIQYFSRCPDDQETKEIFIDLLISANHIEDSIYFLKEFIGFDKNYRLSNYDHEEKYKFLLKFSEILGQQNRHQELVTIFEPLVPQFPDDITICSIYDIHSTNLVYQLCEQNRFDEAKEVIRSNMMIKKLFNENLERKLKAKGRSKKIKSVYDLFEVTAPMNFSYAENFIYSENLLKGIIFFYKLCEEDPEIFCKKGVPPNLMYDFKSLLYEMRRQYYPEEYTTFPYLPQEVEFYEYEDGSFKPKTRIEIAKILLNEPELFEIALTELKKASEDKLAEWNERISIARLLIKYNLDLNFALAELNRAATLDATHSTVYYLLAATYLKKGEYKSFYHNIEIAIDKNPDELESFNNEILELITNCTTNLEQLKNFVIKIESRIDQISYRFNNYKDIKSKFEFMLGIICDRENDIQNAISHYEAAILNDNKLYSVYPYFGNTLIKENKPISASSWFLRGRSNTKRSSDTYEKCTEGLAILAINQSNWKEAFDYYNELTKLHPKNEDYYQKSLICFQNIKFLISKPPSISDDERKIVEKQVGEWEKTIRRFIVEKIPNYKEIINDNAILREKIHNDRIMPHIANKPFKSINELNLVDFLDIRDYPKIITKDPEFKSIFGSNKTFNYNIECIVELRNMLAHQREFDDSDFYHGKAALIWFDRIFEKQLDS